MYILNFFIIPVILVSLFCRVEFSYVISLVCSLGAATFIYAHQGLPNIVFTIAIFNLTPLFCLKLVSISRSRKLSIKASKEEVRLSYQRMQKERSIIRQSNSHLSEKASQISELYKITRDMSKASNTKDVFNIFGKKITELFRFKRCRLILIEEDVGVLKVEKVFELKYPQAHVNQTDAETNDTEILKQSLRAQNISYIERSSTVLFPLIAENKSLGTLAVEGLPLNESEDFSTMANQFCLVMERIKLYEKIQKLAINDGLTGLFVRRYFLMRLDEEVKRSARHNLHLAFLMIDIDHFKQCNDSFGHLTGDAVLKEVARQILDCVREIDLVARFGGEEFSVLLPDTDKVGAANVAERIRSSIDRQKINAYDETIKVKVSIGVAGFPEDSTEAQGLIEKSDQALYRAKQEGRNRVCVFGD